MGNANSNEVEQLKQLYSMNNSELLNKTKELKQMMSLLDGANSKTYFVGPASIEYNKLKIQKNNHGELILKGPSKVTYAVTDTLTLDAKTNILLGSHNDKMYLLISACYVDCSKFNSKFNKMIKPIFINGRELSNDQRPFIIAEISANHNGSIEECKKRYSFFDVDPKKKSSAITLESGLPEIFKEIYFKKLNQKQI